MPNNIDLLINSIDVANTNGTLFSEYISNLSAEIAQVSDTAQKDPTLENVRDWLRVYSHISALAVEKPADVTLELINKNNEIFNSALGALSPDEKEEINSFVKSLDDKDLTIGQFKSDTITIDAAPVVQGIFTISNSFDGTRVRLYEGTLALFDRSGNPSQSFRARTGGFVADFKTHNGPTPPGFYKIDSFISNPEVPGMKLNGITFCFALSPVLDTNVFKRSGLCIHPDEKPDGTHGCIGISGDADQLKQCRDLLSTLSRRGKFASLSTMGLWGQLLNINSLAPSRVITT
jgi:L,D-transpeptidase catalytic domain